MKIGVSAFAWTTQFTRRHLDILPKMGDYGLSGFEIAMFDPADLPASEIRRAIRSSGLELSICAILPGGVNPVSPDAAIRNEALVHLLRSIEIAAEMGAHLICGPVYAPIGYLRGRRRNPDEWNWAVECLQSLGVALDAHEITLAVEPVNRSETFILNTAEEAKQLCAAIDHPRIGVTIDTFHANIEEKNIAQAATSLGKRLKHVHVSENDRGRVGSGHVDFSALLTALRTIEYEGCLMIEGFGFDPKEPSSFGALWGDPSVSPEDIAFQGANYLRNLLRT